jgi:hypothetical protein
VVILSRKEGTVKSCFAAIAAIAVVGAMLGTPCESRAGNGGEQVSGGFIHQASKGGCTVDKDANGDYVFTNERGHQARFRLEGYRFVQINSSPGWSADVYAVLVLTKDQVVVWFSVPGGGWSDQWWRPK